MSIYVEWSRICLDPGRLQRQTLPHVLQWLPWATRHALLAEVRGAGVAQTASAPSGKVGNAGSRSDRAVVEVAAPQHTETPRAAAGGDSEGARSETALIFLSFVLAPAVSLDEENTLAVQSSALHRLEVTVALLLRCASQLNRSTVPAAYKGVNDASVWADVLTGTAAASLRLWVRFYCLFFLEQLYTERCRVAVLHATAAHPCPSRSLPSQTPAATAAAAAAAAKVREPPRNSNSEVAFLRSHPLFRRGHLLHVFALKVQDAVRRCCCGLESGSDVSAAVKEVSCVLPARRGAAYKGGLQQRWQARSTGEQRQQRRSPAKHASCGVPRRQAAQLRRRRQRSSSSESTISSPSQPSDASSSSSAESEDEEEEEAAAAKESATAAKHSAAEEDGDIPLAALACQRTQSR